tara:strand:+ start:4868 stop:5005 length:138 start_codon:yes stop_codon:yes gene_type:complete
MVLELNELSPQESDDGALLTVGLIRQPDSVYGDFIGLIADDLQAA